MIKTHKIYYPLYNDKEHFIFLITGGRGCERPDQEVIMADLSVKQIKDIRVGDYVMGDDGTPRKVLDTYHGFSEMFEVWQSNGEKYYVNDGHILSLRKSHSAKNDNQLNRYGQRKFPNGRYPDYPDEIDMPITEYLKQTKRWQYHFRGYKVGSIPYPHKDVLIDPYLLGLWIGDGTAALPQITTPDKEIVDYLYDYAEKHNLHICVSEKNNGTNKAKGYRLSGSGEIGGNEFLNSLKAYNLINNKHIPQCYISNSEKVRLQLLAGLLDTDASYDGYSYDFAQKDEQIAKAVRLIGASLGFRVILKRKKAKIGDKEYGLHYRISISGDVWRIPCKVKHKIAHKGDAYNDRTFSQSSLRIKSVGNGKWCGIHLDGNQRYVHSDGTVTHNSGKSFGVGTFIERLTFEYNAEKRIAHQILYSRYTLTSAAMSVIPEFNEKIELDDTAKYFHRANNDMVNTITKSRVMFRGIHTSSGNQTAKLKSIQGLTVFVCDEAEEWVSEDEFEKILLSIRTKGLRNIVVIIMNPCDTNHWVYRRFIKNTHRIEYFDGVPVEISTHESVMHIHTSYLNNIENLSEEFLKEALRMKQNDPARYAHVFMGQWASMAEGAIYPHFGICDEFPSYAKKVAIGIDWGYTNDKTAITLCGVVDNRLYVKELLYETGLTSAQIIKFLRPYAQDGIFCYADSADPRLIDELNLAGVICYAVQKGAGSIVAGIDKVKTMELMVTKDSLNLQEELRGYVWMKDPNGSYINQPDPRCEDHLCDSFRYYVAAILLGKVMHPKRVTKEQLGVY